MTTTDRKAFDAAFNRLAKCGLIHDDDAVAKRLFFDALADLPIWAIERAELHLRRTPVPFFTSAVWHDTAEQILAEQRRRDTAALAAQGPKPQHCAICRDTGFRSTSVDSHDRHRPCECRETNPNYLAGRARAVMAADGQADPSPAEAKRLWEQVRDWKQIGTGE